MAGKRKGRKPKLGSGARFKSLSKSLKRKGIRNPDALAASTGRKRWGKKKMAAMSATGRKRAARKRKR